MQLSKFRLKDIQKTNVNNSDQLDYSANPGVQKGIQ